MLTIDIEHNGRHESHQHLAGPLFIGRIRDDSESFIEVHDEYMSRKQLLLEELSGGRVRFENLGRNEVRLPDGRCFQQGQAAETELPTCLSFAYTNICVAGETSAPSRDRDHNIYDTIAKPASARGAFATLGDTPSAERLAEWFETLLSVQRSAVGSEKFYQETAQALVDLIGLDRGLVLLRNGDRWTRAAGHSRRGEDEPAYSKSILSRVVSEAGTVTSHPHGIDLHASLAKLEAAVGAPIFDSNGNVVGSLYGSRDFSVDKQATTIRPLEAQLVQLLAHSVTTGLNRMAMLDRLKQTEQLAAVGQALGYILHDLRGPLGNAQQLTEMLRNPETATLSPAQQMDFIDESLAISLDLLNDSLEFCRGNIQLQLVKGNCRQLLAKHLRSLALKLDSMNVALRIDIPDQLDVVLDPARIARVLQNLAKNAGEALGGREGGLVTITAGATAGGTSVTVSDNGSGLPDEVRKRLFQPFGTHGKRGGTGFGLAIAKQLVDAHQGTIEVSSGTTGTAFTIFIPVGEYGTPTTSGDPNAADKTESDWPASIPSSKPPRVLVAEDGLVNQALISGLLKEQGCPVTLVKNGALAIAEWETQPYDLILMDIEMPEMGGLEATRIIRQREGNTNRRIPIIALTAHQSDENRAECLQAGMNDFLIKPPTGDSLTRLMRESCSTT